MPLTRLIRLAPALMLAACSLRPATPPAPELPIPDVAFDSFTLDNGLTVVVHTDHSKPLVAVNIWYHVGSKNEEPGRTGFAHLFEHLMFNGSENHDDEFFRPLESAGATDLNGTTNADRTNYFATVPTPALDTLLWLESDRMGHLLGAIDQAKLDEQRGVVQNEKRQRENQPYGKVWDLIPPYSYPPEHPYSWSTIGSMADLDAASLDDVKRWFSTWYGPGNAVVVLAGDITSEQAREKMAHYFGDIPPGPKLSRARYWPAPMAQSREVEIEDQVPQARSYFVWNVAPNYSRDLVALQIAADALANGKNSQLYQELVYREQTATDVGAFVLPREMGSQFMVWVTARPEADIERLEQQVLAAVARLSSDGVSSDELERSRTGLYVSMIRGMQKLGGFGGRSDLLASSQVLAGRPDAWRDELNWLREIKPAEVRDTAGRWLRHGHLRLRVKPAVSAKASGTGADRSALPQPGPARALELPPLQRFSLSNGLPVVLVERHDVPLVELRLLARGGYSADPAGREGLASLTMQLLDEGAGERDALQLAEALERLGANISSWASLDLSTVSLSAVRTRLEPALTLYRDVITAPQLPQAELDRLRPRALAGIEQERANPVNLALRVLPPLLYGEGHPYAVPLTGSGRPESLEAISLDDIRAFYRRHITPANSQLLVVGDISRDELEPLLEAEFGNWRTEQPAPALKLPAVAQAKNQRIYLVHRPGAPQSLLLAGHLAPARDDPQDLALRAANQVFGGMFTSRINLNLREDKHWSYGAGSTLISTAAQRPFVVYGRVQADKTVAAMREIVRELEQMRGGKPVRTEELQAVVKQQTLSLPGRNETLGELAGSVTRILTEDLPDDYYARFVAQMNAMQAEQAQEGARRLLQPQALTWIVIGDLTTHRAAIEALGWGPVTELDPGDL